MAEIRMGFVSKLFLCGLAIVSPVLAQGPPSQAEEALAAAGCLGGCGMIVLIPLAMIVSGIAMLVWVARDAKARGMDNSVMWMIVVFFTSFLGLIIYIFSRPQGKLVPCQHCQNNRLETSALCPHCGHP